MVENSFRPEDAAAFCSRYPDAGEDVAMRVYTSRLLGAERSLVLHGGGNTSVKTMCHDRLGDELEVLMVKGSGCDLAELEPEFLPAVELAPVRRLLELDAIPDHDVANEVRRRLLDVAAPDPSVEALLHAAIPRKFVDHTHADAVLVLSNQPNGAELVSAALGDRVAVLPYAQPGFPLAKAVAAAYEANPELEAIVLLHHGIFTFADDARTSYDRMIDCVNRAEAFARERVAGEVPMLTAREGARSGAELDAFAAQVIPNVRGAVAIPASETSIRRMLCSWRGAADLVAMSMHPDCCDLVASGPLTPDHVIRTSVGALYLTEEQAADPAACREAVTGFVARYEDYFNANRSRMAEAPEKLDGRPRVVVVQGLGVLAFGETVQAAAIAGDIAEQTMRGKACAAALGDYTPLPAGELFDMEYWPRERAKLGGRQPAELEGQVALVAGGAGGIGFGVCEALSAAGAVMVVADLNETAANDVVDRLRARYPTAPMLGLAMDVTDAESVDTAFAAVARRFGGVDIVVANAGIAHVSTLRDMEPAAFQRVLNVNLFGTMTVLRSAAGILEAQGTRGSVVVQASKNVFAPGASFGAYSASKAGQHQLGKIAALEFAPLGVRVNMINADAVFGDAVPSGLWQEVGPDRMKSRGLDEQGLRDYYRDRSLLKVTVTPRHVGEAVVFLSSDAASATTGMTFTVDGGVAAAFPR